MTTEDDGALDINGIMRFLAHRPPMLLVDKVLSCVPGKSLRAQKNVTMNEPFFVGHFPGHPVMPGVMIIEAMAQAACLLAYRTLGTSADGGMLFFFAGIDNARFRRQVVPGDVLALDIQLTRISRGLGKFACRATVDGQAACEADLMAAVRVGDQGGAAAPEA